MASSKEDPRRGDRIAKLLARAGVASRREIERMIEDGRIALDGAPVTTPATILASLRGVTVDGRPVEAPAPARLFLFHKPTGLLVTERDPRGRPTIYDRLPKGLPRVVPVGRLDLNTEGLLLLTTDGGFKRQLELPATGVERSYRARAYGNVTQVMLEELAEGIEIDGIRYGSIDANIERRTGANVWIEMTLTEGKNREVRRVLEHLGLQVSRLIRTRYGPFVLGDLPVGEVGEVKQHELVGFRKTLKGGAPDEPVPAAPAAAAPARPGFRAAPRPDRAPAPAKRPAKAKPAEAQPNRAARRAAMAASGDLVRRVPDGAPAAARPRPERPARKPAAARGEQTAADRPARSARPQRPTTPRPPRGSTPRGKR